MTQTLNELVRADPFNPQPEFIVDDNNRDMLNNLMYYLSRKEGSLNLNMGIIFSGGVGNGKTRMIECIQAVMEEFWMKKLCVFNATYIRDNYYETNNDDNYSLKHKLHTYRFIAINDIGMEKNYSSGVNIIQNILFDRYEKRLITHGTTNLSPKEFFKRYADDKGRMVDRYNTMFNYVQAKGGSKRK